MKDRIIQPGKSLPETKGKPLAEINVLLYIFRSRIQLLFYGFLCIPLVLYAHGNSCITLFGRALQ